MYRDHRLLSVAAALETVFASSPDTARPTPDFDWLTQQTPNCRAAKM